PSKSAAGRGAGYVGRAAAHVGAARGLAGLRVADAARIAPHHAVHGLARSEQMVGVGCGRGVQLETRGVKWVGTEGIGRGLVVLGADHGRPSHRAVRRGGGAIMDGQRTSRTLPGSRRLGAVHQEPALRETERVDAEAIAVHRARCTIGRSAEAEARTRTVRGIRAAVPRPIAQAARVTATTIVVLVAEFSEAGATEGTICVGGARRPVRRTTTCLRVLALR